MKRILAVATAVLLMGAGCTTNTYTNTSTDNGAYGQPTGQATTNQNPNGQDYSPNGQPGVDTGASAGAGVSVGSDSDAPAPMTANVSYDGKAFGPASVTIAKGGTIVWTNNGSGPMWVASDPHPTHTDYPGFDAKQAIAPGHSWSFRFTTSGTWGYHNHMKSSDRGTVVVK